MNKIKYLTIAIGILCLFSSACQKTVSTNAAQVNTNTTAVNTNAETRPPVSENKPVSDSPGSLATPTDTYKTAYAARKNKDVEGLKRTMTDDVLDFLKMMGEEDHKTVDDMLKELCEVPQAPTNETRNEKISGDTATVEYPDETGNWRTMDFEKVGGVWKMGIPGGPKGEKPKKK